MTAVDRTLSVLVADDDPKVRRALIALVSSLDSLELVGAAADADETIELAREHLPDVAVIDVEIPKGGGARAVRELLAASPHTRVVALSGFADRAHVMQMLDNGAIGYMVKSASLDLLSGILTAGRGEASLSFRTVEGAERFGGGAEEPPGHDAPSSRVRQMRQVIDERHFHVAFQPIIDLNRRTVLGVEALARFSPDPLQTPDLWFADASAFGLDRDLELAVVAMALDAASLCPPDMFLAINLSPGVAASPGLSERLAGTARDLSLVVEVSDRGIPEHLDDLLEVVAGLRVHGVRFAIDDAGAGGDGLAHYAALAPDLIKIDAAVVAQIDRDEAQMATASEIVSAARDLDATVVAEGIETPAQLECLIALGVGFGQGYLLGRPGPLPLDPRVTMA